MPETKAEPRWSTIVTASAAAAADTHDLLRMTALLATDATQRQGLRLET
eukprot:CAMPEP_0204035358 /NCGR_PEP_ID=MMETSP0360-20130528/75828_1 /ASSEMBLY_ACC=CAM_ASM_000342 /TAXON_ID=268821 /ORGANISM="Scrippsiella Hangoei, Strain SHTV-5" /LENGTH=48 /DNA_ID= /DNA_START= /DNA_END= /DNA_ORIENTATION=